MPKRETGATLVDLVIVLLAVGVLAAVSAPLAASVVDTSRARHAAAFMGSRFRLARQQAVGLGANVGVVFEQTDDRWSVRVCRDGTGNGIRRADIQSGADPCFDGPYDIGQLFPTVSISVDPTLRGPGGEAGSPDPVRFGTADIASFSPLGSSTAGSLFLQSRLGTQYVVRVGGVTGRIRMLWYEPATRGWRER